MHCDLKPENVLVSDDRKTIKLSDFGLAVGQELGDKNFVPEKTYGIFGYMAPELLMLDHAEFSSKSDMYAFAILVWVMMTEPRPWHRMSASQVIDALRENLRPKLSEDNLPQKVANLIKFCWQGGPPQPKDSIDERYSAVQALDYFKNN